MSGPAAGAEAYYANFGEQSVADYVRNDIFASATEMDRLHFALRLVPDAVGTLLDVGAGPGVFLHLLRQERRIEGVGIELTASKVEYARSALKLDVRVGSAEQLPFGEGAFDAVTAFEVIEHLPFGVYERALGELARVARRFVIIAVPYREHRVLVRCPYCTARFHPHYHMRSFDEQSLSTLSSDLRLTRLETHGHVREFVWPVNRIYAARAARNGLPPYALCPSCGFRAGSVPRPAADAAAPARSRRSWASGLTRLIPRITRPRWVFAVYEKARHP